jgi:hypothetical protein
MTNKKAELATKKQFTQDNIPDMLIKVRGQLEELTGSGEAPKSTKGVEVPGFGTLESITDVQELIKAWSSIKKKYEFFLEAKKDLGIKLKLKAYTCSGVSIKDWKAAIEIRIAEVANEVQIKKLQEIEKTLESNLSAQDKLSNDLAKINSDMEDISF